MGARRAAVIAALTLWTVVPVLAEDVTLSATDGELEISGTLLDFDGETYRLDTVYGILSVNGAGVSCTGAACPDRETFVSVVSISGSAAMGTVLMPALMNAFALRHGYDAKRTDLDATHFEYRLQGPDETGGLAIFRFRVTTSDEGFADLLAGEADLAMSLREIRTEERDRADEAGLGDLEDRNRFRVLALDALVPVVSPQNPVREISPRDLARVFAGKIDNWSALGGANAPIARHAPSRSTGLGQATEERISAIAGLPFAEEVSRHDDARGLVDAVLADPFALGLSSFAEAGETQRLSLKGDCGRVLGATRSSIKSGDYPFSAPMFLYTPMRRLPEAARAFLAFVQGPTGQVVVRRAGFVDQGLEEIPLDRQGGRLANAISAAGREVPLSELQRMVGRFAGYSRLTIAFRFEDNAVGLDARSKSNVQILARDLEAGRFGARELLFVGFSDGAGSAENNRQAALIRAEAVRDAVLLAARGSATARTEVAVESFGEAMPLACEDSAAARRLNQRVEVWVR